MTSNAKKVLIVAGIVLAIGYVLGAGTVLLIWGLVT